MEILLLAIFIGMRHAIEADHLSAIASLATRDNTPSSIVKIAATWGLGHTLTLVFMGFIVLSMNFELTNIISSRLEFIVGIMLIVMGAEVLWRLKKGNFHMHAHSHDGIRHMHIHSHESKQKFNSVHLSDFHSSSHHNKFRTRSLLVGMVHGH